MSTGIPARAGAATALVVAMLVIAATGCDPLPRDAGDTLERVRSGTLRVGVTEAPPWLGRVGDAAVGPEAEVIEAFARTLDARVDWRWAPLDDNMEKLSRRELDLVAGGLTARSAWKSHVGLTRPYHRGTTHRRVFAVPPGENGFLVELERFLHQRSPEGRP